jgi:hypothetical protein
MRLANQEKETIIVFNEEDKMATIFTYNKKWINHLEKTLGLKPFMKNNSGGREYEIEKKRITPPHKKRQYSEESKKKRAMQLAKAREMRKSTKK